MTHIAPLILIVSLLAGAPVPLVAKDVDFVRDIEPIFTQHCVRCHQPGKASGNVSLATSDDLLANGYVEPGRPDASYLLELVAAHDGASPAMPKEGQPLDAAQVATLRAWIAAGAAWPREVMVRERSRADRTWWSLRPLADVEPPQPGDMPAAWRSNPVDRFVYASLTEKGLHPNEPAERRTLIRRVTYDLIGLPPTPDEIESFLADDSPQAYERLIDRLLASPHYGEHWGRHWLDVIRFGESNGFERNVIIDNAWPVRDWVIRSLNDDKPFDRFVHEHLAGDVLAPDDPEVAVGTGFLVCGPYDNVGNQDPVQAATIRANTLDEMIRATSEAFLGLTVGCARCHDHKFDPITQQDYYGLYATFAGVTHGERIIASTQAREEHAARTRPLAEMRDKLAAERDELRKAIAERAETHAADWEAEWRRPPVSRRGAEESFPAVEARYVRLIVTSRDNDPEQATGFMIDEFEIYTAEDVPRNVALTSAGAKATGASRAAEDFEEAYGVVHTIDGRFGVRWMAAEPRLQITLPRAERIDRIVFSSDRLESLPSDSSKTVFVGEYTIDVSLDGRQWQTVATSATRQPPSARHRRKRLIELASEPTERERLAQLDRELADLERRLAAIPPLPSWWVGRFGDAKGPFHVLLGGDVGRRGDEVRPASLSALSGRSSDYALPADAGESQRRLALARWITAKDNPLTPRVIVNRLWHYHFGAGIVATPSDFGYMGARPTHSELLDWLARRLVDGGWRLKPLHKLIVMSQAYRQSSDWRPEPAAVDADSALLWRFSPRRMSAEEIRDSMLAAAGALDERMGGPGFQLYRYLQDNVATYVPLDEHSPATFRRAVYHQNARAARVDVLADFDCPDPAFAEPRRAATTTPLQALTLLNHSFTLDMARRMAQRVEGETGTKESAAAVERLFVLCYGRAPDVEESQRAGALAKQFGLAAVARALLNSSEFVEIR